MPKQLRALIKRLGPVVRMSGHPAHELSAVSGLFGLFGPAFRLSDTQLGRTAKPLLLRAPPVSA